MAVLTSTFESGVGGNNIATGDAGTATPWDAVVVGTGTGASIKYDNAHAYDALAGKVYTGNPAAGGNYMEWSTAFGTQTDHYGRLYIYVTTGWDTNGFIDFINGAGSACGLFITLTRTVQIRDTNGTVIVNSTTSLALNSWNRIEWHLIHSATVGQVELKLFEGANADGVTPDETVTTAATLNIDPQSTAIRFGILNVDILSTWLDNIVAAETAGYPGPYSAGVRRMRTRKTNARFLQPYN